MSNGKGGLFGNTVGASPPADQQAPATQPGNPPAAAGFSLSDLSKLQGMISNPEVVGAINAILADPESFASGLKMILWVGKWRKVIVPAVVFLMGLGGFAGGKMLYDLYQSDAGGSGKKGD